MLCLFRNYLLCIWIYSVMGFILVRFWNICILYIFFCNCIEWVCCMFLIFWGCLFILEFMYCFVVFRRIVWEMVKFVLIVYWLYRFWFEILIGEYVVEGYFFEWSGKKFVVFFYLKMRIKWGKWIEKFKI